MSKYTNLASSKDDNVSYDVLINLLDYGKYSLHKTGMSGCQWIRPYKTSSGDIYVALIPFPGVL